MNEERTRVRLVSACFHDDRSGNLNEQFTGFNVADLKVFLRLEEVFTEHRLAGEESVASRHAQTFAETEVFGCFREDWDLTKDEVLLDFCALNSVVEVVAFSERVADDVATNFHTVWARSCDEWFGGRT